jgi:hypothetical protein
MAFYAKSETEIQPVEKPPEGELPPLVIWGPGDPRPTVPIAGPGRPPDWGMATDPDYGVEIPPPTTEPVPPEIWGPGDPRPTVPIAEPPWGWGNAPPKPDVDPVPEWDIKYAWTPATGWFVFAIPTGPVPTPSGKGKKK